MSGSSSGGGAGEQISASDSDSQEALRSLLTSARTIAVVGIKDRESADAYRVPLYLQANGYRIVPVNPRLERVLGEPCRDSLREIVEPIDIVDLFRATDHIPGHCDEILAMEPRPRAVWMQLGIHHGASAARLRAEGIAVIEDACIMVEHRRLLGTPAA